jgi:hypothetical protein
MARDYKTGPDQDVHEFLPLTFDVGQFKRTYGIFAKHRTMMDEIDRKIEMLQKDSAGCIAIATTWLERLSAWLQPVFGCLPYDAGNEAVDCSRAERAERYGSAHSDSVDSEASRQNVTARATMVST